MSKVPSAEETVANTQQAPESAVEAPEEATAEADGTDELPEAPIEPELRNSMEWQRAFYIRIVSPAEGWYHRVTRGSAKYTGQARERKDPTADIDVLEFLDRALQCQLSEDSGKLPTPELVRDGIDSLGDVMSATDIALGLADLSNPVTGGE